MTCHSTFAALPLKKKEKKFDLTYTYSFSKVFLCRWQPAGHKALALLGGGGSRPRRRHCRLAIVEVHVRCLRLPPLVLIGDLASVSGYLYARSILLTRLPDARNLFVRMCFQPKLLEFRPLLLFFLNFLLFYICF